MYISKKELALKIARARSVADECYEQYCKDGGSKYPFLAGAYEAVFCELLGFKDFDDFLKKLGE